MTLLVIPLFASIAPDDLYSIAYCDEALSTFLRKHKVDMFTTKQNCEFMKVSFLLKTAGNFKFIFN